MGKMAPSERGCPLTLWIAANWHILSGGRDIKGAARAPADEPFQPPEFTEGPADLKTVLATGPQPLSLRSWGTPALRHGQGNCRGLSALFESVVTF